MVHELSIGDGGGGAVTTLELAVGADLVVLQVADEIVAMLLQRALGDLVETASSLDPPGSVHDISISIDDDRLVLAGDGAEVRRSFDRAHIVDALIAWCNLVAIASRPDHVNLHAACLTVPDSAEAVIAAAPSTAGKTTLAVAACLRGWGYLSDEVASVRADAAIVRAYPKPLTVKAGSRLRTGVDLDAGALSAHQQRWYVRPGEVGGSVVRAGRPAVTLFPSWRGGAALTVSELSITEATLELATNSQDQLDADGAGLLTLATLASRTHRRRVEHDDVDAVLDLVVDLAGRPADLVAAPSRLVCRPSPGTTDREVLRPHPDVAAVLTADGAVVHHTATQELLALDPVGGAVFALLDGATRTEAAVAQLARAFDEDEAIVARDVATLIDRLRAHGVLIGDEA